MKSLLSLIIAHNRIVIFMLVLVALFLFAGCQTHYYPATKDHATQGEDGKWRGPVKKEGVPDWSPGKSLNLNGLKAG